MVKHLQPRVRLPLQFIAAKWLGALVGIVPGSAVAADTYVADGDYWLKHDLASPPLSDGDDMNSNGGHFTHEKRADVVPAFQEIDRRANLTREDFINEYAVHGKPVVVIDGIHDWDSTNVQLWTATSLNKLFPNEVNNRQSAEGEELFDASGKYMSREDRNVEVDGTGNSIESNKNSKELLKQILEKAQEKVWTQREHISWLNLNKDVSEVLKESYRSPYFFRGLAEYSSGEYFFLGQRGRQGREKHIDYTCNSTWSVQLNGRKIWRLYSPSHPLSQLRTETEGFTDFDHSAHPATAYETLLKPGEIIVWFPGWSHETFAVDEINSAMSSEFRLPPPTLYFEKYDKLFRAHGKEYQSFDRCLPLWKQRERVFREMEAQNFSHFLLCEEEEYGDCSQFKEDEAIANKAFRVIGDEAAAAVAEAEALLAGLYGDLADADGEKLGGNGLDGSDDLDSELDDDLDDELDDDLDDELSD